MPSLGIVLAAAAVALALVPSSAQAGPIGPADALTRPPAPAAGHELMIDLCDAPPIETVSAWQRESPYKAIAVYVEVRSDYDSRLCEEQPHLSTAWVKQTLAGGWQVLPIHLGLQAPCSAFEKKMSANAATARAQGIAAANDAAASVRELRIPATAPVVSNIEAYTTNPTCAKAVQSYVAGWTTRLHQLDLRAAVYGSRLSTITDVTNASKAPNFPQPDVIWVANYNGQANTTFPGVPPADMWVGRRISQFNQNVIREYGDISLKVDENAVQLSVWDRTAPKLVAPMPPHVTKNGRVRIGWRASDPSGVAGYQVRIRHNNGRWKSPKALRDTRRNAQRFSLKPGERWCVQARATDRVGNTTAWSIPRCTARLTDDRSLRGGKVWKRVRGGYLRTGLKASRAGAVLRGRRVAGTRVTVLMRGSGTLAVAVGGRRVGTLHGNGLRTLVLPRAVRGTIALRTLDGKPVVVDGYAVTP